MHKTHTGVKKQWHIRDAPPKDFITAFPDYHPLLLTLLWHRGITNEEAMSAFLEPQYEKLHDPFLLSDMDKAVERIAQALTTSEKITVYGDYDADAVTASAVLLRTLHALGAHCDSYIPDRFSEGYGLHEEAMQTLHARGTGLVITVDCGINAVREVDRATALGMDVIITDHHHVTGSLPKARAVINPKRQDDTYPFDDLTGVGVAFKLVQALLKHLGENTAVQAGWEKWLLDLVAIGTVADCQTLLGENRILVKYGLTVLGRTRWTGLRKLMEKSRLRKETLDTHDIGFVIAPRINAAGRMDHASSALELLLSDDASEAEALSDKLEELNRMRRQVTDEVLAQARTQLKLEHRVLLAMGEGWPKGVVGLVASRLCDEYARPVLVLSHSEGVAVGSARSIDRFNIIEAISECHDFLLRFGGHAGAAGFTVKNEFVGLFHERLLEIADKGGIEKLPQPFLDVDASLSLHELSWELVDQIRWLEPYGLGNPRPKFLLSNLEISDIRTVGANSKHLKLALSHPDDVSRAWWSVGFGFGQFRSHLSLGERVDVVAEIGENQWNGNREIQVKILDLEKRVKEEL